MGLQINLYTSVLESAGMRETVIQRAKATTPHRLAAHFLIAEAETARLAGFEQEEWGMRSPDWLTGDAIIVILKASSSVKLLRIAAEVSKDFEASANQVRPAVLRHLARAGRQTAEGVIKDIAELNPAIERLQLPSFVQDTKHDMYGSMLDWDMSNRELEILPDSLGYVCIVGTLDLSKNKLRAVPRSFGNLVCGSLDLSTNFIERIPETFWTCKVANNLRLHENDFVHADSLPETFGGLIVGGNLSMCYCRLTVLPESFGDMSVGGDLDLHGNVLTTVPSSFGLIRVLGEIDLRMNELHEIPASIGHLAVGKTLRLNSNAIVDLPESFKQIKVGGDLDLRCNHLMDWDPAFFKSMSVVGHVRYGQQTVFDAEYHARLAEIPDSDWMDPVTGAFRWAPVPDASAQDLAPDLFPYGSEILESPAAPTTEYEHAAPSAPMANY